MQSHPIKHFTLKRKPKSAALRAELLQKSTDAQNNLKKNPAPTVPLRSRGIPRKMTDTTPLKGIPSRHIGGFASPLSRAGSTPTGVGGLSSSPSAGPNRPSPRTLAGRKDGGIKLLDINEQPIGFAQAKKRKRQQGIEFEVMRCWLYEHNLFNLLLYKGTYCLFSIIFSLELEAAQKAASESQSSTNATQPLSGEESESGSASETPEKPAPTPDYAAGLLPNNPPPTPAAPMTPLASTSIPTLTPLKEPPRIIGVRPPVSAISSLPPASPAGPAQVVRLVTTQPPTANPPGAAAVPTVYRLVQPAAAVVQPVVVSTVPANQPAAPPKKSVALMLTVSFKEKCVLNTKL